MKFKKSIIIALFNLNCSDNPTSKKDEDKKIPPVRTIAPIPGDLESQRYVDANRQEVSYDHKAQLEQLFQLEKASKKLHLIIGRGNGEISSKLPLGMVGAVWLVEPGKDTLHADSSQRIWYH